MIKLIAFISIFTLAFNLFAETKIYKYTDEDGNIYYSDKKPFEGAEEADLKPITIIESSKIEPVSTRRRIDHQNKQVAAVVENFTVTTPTPGSTLWGTGGNVLAAVSLDVKLNPNHRIKFFLDDLPHGKVKSNSQLIADIERGEHTLYAQLIDASSRRVIKSTPTITFYLKQHSKK